MISYFNNYIFWAATIESKHFDVREAIVKTCKDNNIKQWNKVLPHVLWAERVTIQKTTGYSPYFMAHSIHPLLPLDIVESTFLAPKQDFGISTEELIAIRARQLQKRPKDIQRMQEIVTENHRNGLKRFERQHRSRVVDFDHQPGALVLVRNSRIKDALNRKTLP